MGYDEDRIRHKNEKWARNIDMNAKIGFLKALEGLLLKEEDYAAKLVFPDFDVSLANDIREELRKTDRDWLIDNEDFID
jgi:hypothetical protein